jgi:hypothetical protein
LLVPLVLRRARAADLYAILRRSGESLTNDTRSRGARHWLVGAEIAIAVMLACAAGIVGKSLRYFQGIDAGFDANHVVVARPDYYAVRYDQRRQILIAEETMARLSSVREVSDLTYWRRIPQSFPPPPIERVLSIQGSVGPLEGHRRLYWFYEVGPRFFETLGLRLLEGRVFDARDQRASQPVAVINSTAAERWWPNESALGKRVSLNPQDPAAWVTVVGVVKGVSLDAIDRQQVARDIRRPQLYRPLVQGGELAAPYWMWDASCSFCARIAIAALASTDTDLAGRALRQAIDYVDPGLPLGDVVTMYDEQLGRAGYAGPMLQRNARTVGSFATVALLLAMLGVYGVVADGARARTRELSVRLVLGATPVRLLRMLLRENVLLAVSSIAFGGLLYWNLSRVAGGLLFGGQYLPLLFKQSAVDPKIIAPILLVAVFVVTMAVAMGSRRALTMDPREGLHAE